MSDVLVIIPAYNEQSRIAQVLQSIQAVEASWDILVVNDGSADATAEEARRAGARVVSHPFNLGYGATLQTGYKYACAKGYAYAVQMDADGQHIADQVPKLLVPLKNGEADLVIGSRFLEGGGGYPIPLLRKAGMTLFRMLARILSGKHLTDVTSGFSAVNRRTMQVTASDLFPADYPDADVRLMMLKLGLKIIEVPAAMRSDESNKSMHGGILVIWYVIKMLISMLIVWITKFQFPYDKENGS